MQALSDFAFFRVWLRLGLQSFGGGVATLALIRRVAVEELEWVSAEEFARCWALVQLAPGVNLLGLTILLGRTARGHWRGVPIALFGMLLPSVTITILLTAGYGSIAHARLAQAALRGVIPAVLGLGLLNGYSIVRPLLKRSASEGRATLILSALIPVLAGLALFDGRIPVAVILVGCGLILGAWKR